jgi:L-galactose dehydrogenase
VAGALDRGQSFDVSPYYGLTLAEARLGRALTGKRSKILLGTKCGRYGVDGFDFSGETLTCNFEQSLLRMKTDYVDLLQAHDIEFGHISQILGETLPAMRRLQEQGKGRFLGLTG